ncbi:MAG: hypothetical protein AVDCRST_MAG25-3668, partial [uncultured Rubrobacteraceae bacterium]
WAWRWASQATAARRGSVNSDAPLTAISGPPRALFATLCRRYFSLGVGRPKGWRYPAGASLLLEDR